MLNQLLKSLLGAAALIALAVPAAAAGPPFITDDPEPVEFHHWEVYIASQYFNFHQPAGAYGTGPHLEVNYGPAPNLQVHLIAPMAWADFPGGTNYGYGDTELGAKYRFVQETSKRPQIGTFPLLEVPTGSEARGLGTGRVDWFVPVWIQKTWGSVTSYGGGGYWHNSGLGGRDYWYGGWQAQYQLTKPFALGAEIFYTTSQYFGFSDRTAFNIGWIYDFDEGHHLMFSAGTQIAGQKGTQMYIAYQWTFGPHERAAAGHQEEHPGQAKPGSGGSAAPADHHSVGLFGLLPLGHAAGV